MINSIRIWIAELLHTVIYETDYFFVDYWSLIHFIAGFLMMFLIIKFFNKMKDSSKFVLLFAFVVFWEIFELTSAGGSIYLLYGLLDGVGPLGVKFLEIVSSWIVLESWLDIIYDLIIGMFAGGLYYLFHKNFKVFSRLH